MIDRIVVENFKSLRRVDLKLGRMNLLIGANASGKSNFLDALRVLQGIGPASRSAKFSTASRRARPARSGTAFAAAVPRRAPPRTGPAM